MYDNQSRRTETDNSAELRFLPESNPEEKKKKKRKKRKKEQPQLCLP
jgi:hypothetical protein